AVARRASSVIAATTGARGRTPPAATHARRRVLRASRERRRVDRSRDSHASAGGQIGIALGQCGQDRILRLDMAEVSLELTLILSQGIQCWPQRAPFLLLKFCEQLVKRALLVDGQCAVRGTCAEIVKLLLF